MKIRYTCAGCGKTVSADTGDPGVRTVARIREGVGDRDDEILGWMFQCPHCQKWVTIDRKK